MASIVASLIPETFKVNRDGLVVKPGATAEANMDVLRADGTWGGPGLFGSATIDPASLAPGGVQNATIAVTGAAVGAGVVLGLPQAHSISGIQIKANVQVAGTVQLRYTNNTSGTVDLASGLVRAWVINP